MNKALLTLGISTLSTIAGAPLATAKESTTHNLWYQQPAESWQMEALPIGNGKLGAMVFGKVAREQIMFNEDSLWIGDENDTSFYQPFTLTVDMSNPPSNAIPQLIGGGPKTNRATVILGEWIQGKLNIRMEDLNGKEIVGFSV